MVGLITPSHIVVAMVLPPPGVAGPAPTPLARVRVLSSAAE